MFGAVDIGGTKVALATLPSDYSIAEYSMFPTPDTYQGLLSLVKDFFAEKTVSKVGVASAGSVDRLNGGMESFGPNIKWAKQRIDKDISNILSVPVLVENDANCGALGEAAHGAGTGYERVLYVTVSTGIGTGFVDNKQLVTSTLNSEGGKLLQYTDGSLRTFESVASGQSFLSRYGSKTSDIEDKAIWKEYSANLAPGIYNISVILQPDVIVFGGSVSAQSQRFIPYLQSFFEDHKDDTIKTPIIKSAEYPNEAVLHGICALLNESK